MAGRNTLARQPRRTHAGQSETIYSTTTVNTTISGTTTIDYWAQVPGASVLHATRDVVIKGAANDNGISSPTASTRPPSANDNQVSSSSDRQHNNEHRNIHRPIACSD
jgi:hypothetical protein